MVTEPTQEKALQFNAQVYLSYTIYREEIWTFLKQLIKRG
jgi:hypothetical protein